jgi:Fic family protein
MKPPLKPPSALLLLQDVAGDRIPTILAAAAAQTMDASYRHWDTLRHLSPPNGLTVREWWLGIKLLRNSQLGPLPLTAADGAPYRLSMPDTAWEMVHLIDRRASGEIGMPEVVTTPEVRNRYLVSSLIEEAITSSQLEGADTSRAVAKEMLRSGRPPRDRSERMITNNFLAMNAVRGWRDEPLTADRVLELHRIVTDGTLDDPTAAGRLQRPDEERVVVSDRATGEVRFVPPPADQLPGRLDDLCAFANDRPIGRFLHPVVRSILVHLWLASDHPFEDGNGRTARALFYWSMLKHGYWLTEFLSISRILNGAPTRYARSFLYTETDELDATYFVLDQLAVICRSIEDLYTYLRRKTAEVAETEGRLRRSDLNHRQKALLAHALRHPDADYTFHSHQVSHGVVYQSARTDLIDLERRGYLERIVVGQRFHFRPPADLADRLLLASSA